jgi:hypothetical protein
MKAPEYIVTVWNKFNNFPMETLTKAWFYEQGTMKKQRDVSLMKEHYRKYRITGNCFDLSIWLLHEFEVAGIKAYPIGTNLHTEDAHVAVVALDKQGNRYLCDLGDQWIEPVLLEKENIHYTEDKQAGFFPGATISVRANKEAATVVYHRPNGKVSNQNYNLMPIKASEFLRAAEHSQQNIKQAPLLECRIKEENEIVHWEFYNWESMKSTNEGLYRDEKLDTVGEWVDRIHEKTGYDHSILTLALQHYANKK